MDCSRLPQRKILTCLGTNPSKVRSRLPAAARVYIQGPERKKKAVGGRKFRAAETSRDMFVAEFRLCR